MANTERFNALQLAIEARKAVGRLRSSGEFTPARSRLVNDAYDALVRVEDALTLADLNSSIAKLKEGGTDLRKLADRMKRSTDQLKQVATLVNKAAQAVGTLADIVARARSAGIL